jgi:hypothetical protein
MTVFQSHLQSWTLGLGGQEGELPLLPFARRGKGGRSALWVVKYYLINHISSDAFWAKSWGVILNVTWLSAFAFIGKSTHYQCRFISSPGPIEVPFGVRPPLCLFIVPASLVIFILSEDDFEIKSKIYSLNLRLVLNHILYSHGHVLFGFFYLCFLAKNINKTIRAFKIQNVLESKNE